eukprot:CAMPEP_0171479116 /NCGR_PEP_ID=MMETSP0946-20130122/5200_1 /TAXON_ID=109269 /ORGANISM="Vaucheria litorea, Strain CCMP2940" /LENGTH=128 /DNA_ID=CAMNT_0012009919 /DNA_START=18 /DNA_END=401 /DNA_ORIENTATION=+
MLLVLLLIDQSSSFLISFKQPNLPLSRTLTSNKKILFLSDLKSEENVENEANQKIGENSVPIDLPAYVLLMASTVLAIAFVGCIFEATGPNPVMGYVPTYVVGSASLPAFLFLFYAALKKGKAEEEDD